MNHTTAGFTYKQISASGNVCAIDGIMGGIFVSSAPVPLAAPVQSAPTTSTTGGTLAAATYYYKVTAFNGVGETIASNEQSITTTGTTSSNTINWTAVTGATSYRVYRGTAVGAENVFYAVAGGTTATFVDTGAASTAGSPPVANSTGGTITLYDDPAAGTTTKMVDTFAVAAGNWYPLPFAFSKGCNIVVGGTLSATAAFISG